jgi:hypothetical protein
MATALKVEANARNFFEYNLGIMKQKYGKLWNQIPKKAKIII